jgi:hypothetical protein
VATLSFGSCVARASLTLVNIFDNTVYRQTSISAPTNPYGYFFSIGGNIQTSGQFTSATATYPGPGSQSIPIQGTSFDFNSDFFSTLTSLHSSYPFGTYTITATKPSPPATQSGVINYAADYFPVFIPALSAASYNNLQGMNPAAPFNAAFNSYGSNAHDSVAYTWFSVFSVTPFAQVYNSTALNNGTSNYTLPANTLAPFTQYYVEINFDERLNGTDTVNNVSTLQGFDVRTDIFFTTGAVALPEPGVGMILLAGGMILARRRSLKQNHATLNAQHSTLNTQRSTLKFKVER